MSARKRNSQRNRKPMLFSAWNYKVLAAGLLLIIIGFTAMYLENEVEGFISLFISPVMIMAGYLIVTIAILKHDRGSSSTAPEQS